MRGDDPNDLLRYLREEFGYEPSTVFVDGTFRAYPPAACNQQRVIYAGPED
jgi:hypothetical protein